MGERHYGIRVQDPGSKPEWGHWFCWPQNFVIWSTPDRWLAEEQARVLEKQFESKCVVRSFEEVAQKRVIDEAREVQKGL